jgi:hypothetical protein
MKTKITDYQSACEFLKRDPNDRPDVSKMQDEDLKKYINANFELVIITKALNAEYTEQNKLNKPWRPDYRDRNQRKYFSWFEVDEASGIGFSNTFCDYWYTSTYVGSRLCLPSPDHVHYSNKQFEKLHLINQLFTD